MATTKEAVQTEKVMFEEPNHYEKRVIKAQFMLGREKEKPLMDTDEIIQLLHARIEAGMRGFRELYLMADVASVLHHPALDAEGKFPCIFFGNKKYVAWFHTSDNGITRYYTQSPGGQHKLRLDLVDLVGLHLGFEEKGDAYDALKTMLPFAELPSSEQEYRRLNQNLVDFVQYATLHPEVVKPEMVALYKVLIQYAKKRVYDGRTAIDGHALFFLSVDKAADELRARYGVELPRSTVGSFLNWFVTLGWVEKVKPSRIDDRLQERRYNESIVNYTTRKEPNRQQYFFKNEVTYFIVPTFSYVQKKVERRHARLEKWGISYHTVTKRNIQRIFGRNYADMVFPNKGKVKQSKYNQEKKAFVRAFFSLFKIQGYVLKTQLMGICKKAITDKLWTQLSKQTKGLARKMSQALSEAIDVTGEGAVFLSYTLLNPYLPVQKEAFKDEQAFETYLDSIHLVVDGWFAKWLRFFRGMGAGVRGNTLALVPEGGA